MVRQIIRAGKDVITTKPFELDPESAESVLKESQVLGRVVHLNSPGPKLPADIKLIKRWQKEYELGKPVCFQYFTWAKYQEKPDGSWYDDPQLCPAAPVLRLGIYGLSDILRFVRAPVDVSVMQSRIFTDRPTADNAQLSIRFECGALANIYASFCVNDGVPYPNGMICCFENGVVYKNCAQGNQGPQTPAALRLEARPPLKANPIILQEKVAPEKVSGKYQWQELYNAVVNRDPASDAYIEQICQAIKILQTMSKKVTF